MPNKCKDKNGNYVDCETLKALQSKSWKTSDDVSRGTEMREIYKPQEITRKDPSVYDKLQKEIYSSPQNYTVWFRIIFEKYKLSLKKWISQ